jgi:uncharacterized Ntn-hydrolase superfamily protein
MQSAALLVVRAKGGYDEGSDRWVDIRVDDHPSPIEELKRVFQLYDLTMLSRDDPASLLPISGDTARELQQYLSVLGYYPGRVTGHWDAASAQAFTKFIHEHNFENKMREDAKVWPSVLAYLEERAAAETERRTHTAPITTGALDQGPGARPGGSVSKTKSRGRTTPPSSSH